MYPLVADASPLVHLPYNLDLPAAASSTAESAHIYEPLLTPFGGLEREEVSELFDDCIRIQ